MGSCEGHEGHEGDEDPKLSKVPLRCIGIVLQTLHKQ